MVTIVLNRLEYKNDIAEEIRMFLGNVPLAFFEREEETEDIGGELTVMAHLSLEEAGLLAIARARGQESSFVSPKIGEDALNRKRFEKRALKIAVFRLLQKLYCREMPWGSLTGIRPTKLFRDLVEQKGLSGAREDFFNLFDVSEEKIDLAQRVCDVQLPLIREIRPRDIDLYFGIPYCRSRCLYCSFGTELVKDPSALRRYVDAMKEEIRYSARIVREAGLSVRASYFGGGTPSILPPELTAELIAFILREYGSLGKECTFEAGRPDTITAEKLAVLRTFGIDRISINPQTMHNDTLKRIGRLHTAEDVEQVFRLARSFGFAHINMDLIIGLPGENRKDVAESLNRVLALNPENVTVHTLAIKRSSRLKAQLEQYPMVSSEEAEDMVRYGLSACTEQGMEPYYLYRQKYMQGNLENVGYALPGESCLYNIDIMEELVSIMAHGAGSISKRVFGDESRIERVPAAKDVPVYMNKLRELEERKRALFLD